MMIWLAVSSFLLALGPALLFIRNLALYVPLPRAIPVSAAIPSCSVLIPARNEEGNIGAAIASVLQNRGVDFEVIVLDDASTDNTAQIVRQIAARDSRVRLEVAPVLPSGWCGKQHACYLLSQHAKHPLLVFLDADVRLEADALLRMGAFIAQKNVALASGIPRQITKTISERLIIPLIHFVLLGFLPIHRMRKSCNPAYSAGCGQLFVVQREAYRVSGGHRMIPDTLHDGWKLPKVLRAAGFATDLFDATDIASCRMFSSNRALWRGLARNAHEGLGAPRLIGFVTLLLLGGQVLPVGLLAWTCFTGFAMPSAGVAVLFAVLGSVAAFLPRLLAVFRFCQPLSGALMHPIGICGLLGIQWYAVLRRIFKHPTVWKGRYYS